jgi:hypothetical protein
MSIMPEHQQKQKSTESKTTFQKRATPLSQTPASNPFSIIQRAKINPKSLTHADVMQLQRTIGNRAVGMLLTSIGNTSTVQQAPVQRQEIPEEEKTCPSCMQRQEIPEEEEPLQGKMIGTIQRQEIPEEEEPLQGKFENKPEIACSSCFASPIVQRQEMPKEEPLQGKMIETIQPQEIHEEEGPLQGKFERVTGSSEPVLCKVDPTIAVNGVPVNDDPSLEHEADVMGAKAVQFVPVPEEDEPLKGKFGEGVEQKAPNNAGLPDNLKAGIENLSGMSMDGVKVHYNSGKPAQLNALAYAQGQDIHVGPGQEKHLPHEAWHVVQQSGWRGAIEESEQDGHCVSQDGGIATPQRVPDPKTWWKVGSPAKYTTDGKTLGCVIRANDGDNVGVEITEEPWGYVTKKIHEWGDALKVTAKDRYEAIRDETIKRGRHRSDGSVPEDQKKSVIYTRYANAKEVKTAVDEGSFALSTHKDSIDNAIWFSPPQKGGTAQTYKGEGFTRRPFIVTVCLDVSHNILVNQQIGTTGEADYPHAILTKPTAEPGAIGIGRLLSYEYKFTITKNNPKDGVKWEDEDGDKDGDYQKFYRSFTNPRELERKDTTLAF